MHYINIKTMILTLLLVPTLYGADLLTNAFVGYARIGGGQPFKKSECDIEQLRRNERGAELMRLRLINKGFVQLLCKAKEGDVSAMINLGVVSYQHRDDNEGAQVWLTKAAKLGSAKAKNRLGIFLFQKKHDVLGAMEQFREAAELDDAEAMFNLGFLLKTKEDDIEGAQEWYEKAAQKGFALAISNLGSLKQEKGDIDGAEKDLRQAAQMGLVDAKNNLGVLLRDKNECKEARKWLKDAIYEGAGSSICVMAMSNLGRTYEAEDKLDKAGRWYQNALVEDENYIYAQLNLIHLYRIYPELNLTVYISNPDEVKNCIKQFVESTKDPKNVEKVQEYKVSFLERWKVIQKVIDSFDGQNDDTLPAAAKVD